MKIHDLLHLKSVHGLGNSGINNLIKKFQTPGKALRSSYDDLIQTPGITHQIATKIIEGTFDKNPADELERATYLGARIISIMDDDYPPGLRQIHNPPVLLYLKGLDIPPDLMFMAIVGSRKPTHYGLEITHTLAYELAERGIGIVSGLAKGIDAAAHKGCIKGGGFTVAVLGSGIDIVYPSENKNLFEEICECGTIVTEFPIGTPPMPGNFPARNRIISGLSRGVVVTEASVKSGALITASFALDQGRDIFAVPGSINSFQSAGPHSLIKQGARLVENVDDLMDELEVGKYRSENTIQTEKKPEVSFSMNEQESIVYSIIGDYPLHIDKIMRQSKMEIGEVAAILMKMELTGTVKQLFGKMYVRA